MSQFFVTSGRELNPQLNGTFLHSCMYAMREIGTKLMAADGKTVTCEEGVYHIGEQVTTADEAMQAIEYYYQQDPQAFEDDHHFIRTKVLQHRLDKFNGT